MTYPSGPLQPLPLDGPGQRRRRLATGAGILAVAGIVVTGMTFANRPARQPVSPQAALGAPPSSAAASTPVPATAGPSATPASVAASATAPSSLRTSAPPAPTSDAVDVDGDGRPDTAGVRFVTKRSAEVVVHLATGKSLTSKAFPLYHGDGSGTVTPVDVNGDHHSELLVTDPGADGTGYELFSYANGALVEVAAPAGQEQPFLYNGGGMYYQSSFACESDGLVVSREQPAVRSTASLPPDPRFAVTITTYALDQARLTVRSTHTDTVANRAAAAALLARTANACGARP